MHPSTKTTNPLRPAFDPAHNLLSDNGAAPLHDNRLRVYEDKRWDYDNFGNVTTKHIARHTTQRFRWNAEHQLAESVTVRNGAEQRITYGYDAFGRRSWKQDAFGVTTFVRDGNRLLSESRGGRSHLWIYEDDSFAPLAQISLGKGDTEHDAEVYWYHNDVSGMPRELTGAGGEIAWRAEYRAWGNTLRVEHIETRAGEPVYQPLRYQGQYFDAETGLHYNRFRYYDPDAGRFISQDPIGLAGGINLYQYAPNPLVWVDPLGLSNKPCSTKATGNSPPGQGYHNETYSPKPVKPEDAFKRWEDFLGPGPHSNTHPRTGAADPDRIVSADGKRSIRYGNHEMNSKPTKHHYHEETWTLDTANNVMNVDNVVVRVPILK